MSAKLYLFIFLFAFYLGNNIAICQTSNSDAILKSEFILIQKDSLYRTHVSNPLETENGLIVVFRALKGYKGSYGVWLCSNKEGSWSSPREVVPPRGPDNDKIMYVMPVLQNWPDGSIKLFFKELITNEHKRLGMFKSSYDNGKTWSEGSYFEHGNYGPVKNKPRFLQDGTIISPSQTVVFKPEIQGPERFKSIIHFEKSNDGGKSWTKITTQHLGNNNQVNILEPTILIHPNNTLQALCRSNTGRIMETWSHDNGDTWSPISQTPLPNSNAGFDAITLKDGRYLLVYSHTSVGEGRYFLNAAISKDGIDWEAALIIEKDEKKEDRYGYPSIIQTTDGLIHVTYSWNLMNIKHAVIDVTKLKTVPIIDGKWPEEIK